MSFTGPYFIGPGFFRTALRCSGGCHLERGEMPLHFEVRINSKKGELLKIKKQLTSILAKGCMWMIVYVLSDLT